MWIRMIRQRETNATRMHINTNRKSRTRLTQPPFLALLRSHRQDTDKAPEQREQSN